MKHILFFLGTLLAVQLSSAPLSAVTTLDETITQTILYNPNLKEAQESRLEAVHQVRQAEAEYYPSISISAGAGIAQSDSPTSRYLNQQDDTVGAGNVSLLLSQPIWTGGAITAGVRESSGELDVRTWDLMDRANALAYAALSAHADLIRRQVIVGLAVENVRENKAILHSLQTRQSQGLSSLGDVELVKGRVARAEASLNLHQQILKAAEANYTRLTGQPAPLRLAAVPAPRYFVTNYEEARQISLEKNTTIQSNLAGIRSAEAAQDMARSRFAPRISLDAGPSYSDMDYKYGSNYQMDWSVMVNLQWNIFDGGGDTAAFKAATARAQESRHALHSTTDLVDEELKVAFTAMAGANARAHDYAVAATAAKSARANYFKQFQVGQKDLISVLDAEGEYYFSAVEQEINAVDALLSKYRILALTGQLLDELNINPEALK